MSILYKIVLLLLLLTTNAYATYFYSAGSSGPGTWATADTQNVINQNLNGWITLGQAAGWPTASGVYEPAIPAGGNGQVWFGNKSWNTIAYNNISGTPDLSAFATIGYVGTTYPTLGYLGSTYLTLGGITTIGNGLWQTKGENPGPWVTNGYVQGQGFTTIGYIGANYLTMGGITTMGGTLWTSIGHLHSIFSTLANGGFTPQAPVGQSHYLGTAGWATLHNLTNPAGWITVGGIPSAYTTIGYIGATYPTMGMVTTIGNGIWQTKGENPGPWVTNGYVQGQGFTTIGYVNSTYLTMGGITTMGGTLWTSMGHIHPVFSTLANGGFAPQAPATDQTVKFLNAAGSWVTLVSGATDPGTFTRWDSLGAPTGATLDASGWKTLGYNDARYTSMGHIHPVFSTIVTGFVPTAPTTDQAVKFLAADANWYTVAGGAGWPTAEGVYSTIGHLHPVFSTLLTGGFVPAAPATDQTAKFLAADANWYTLATGSPDPALFTRWDSLGVPSGTTLTAAGWLTAGNLQPAGNYTTIGSQIWSTVGHVSPVFSTVLGGHIQTAPVGQSHYLGTPGWVTLESLVNPAAWITVGGIPAAYTTVGYVQGQGFTTIGYIGATYPTMGMVSTIGYGLWASLGHTGNQYTSLLGGHAPAAPVGQSHYLGTAGWATNHNLTNPAGWITVGGIPSAYTTIGYIGSTYLTIGGITTIGHGLWLTKGENPGPWVTLGYVQGQGFTTIGYVNATYLTMGGITTMGGTLWTSMGHVHGGFTTLTAGFAPIAPIDNPGIKFLAADSSWQTLAAAGVTDPSVWVRWTSIGVPAGNTLTAAGWITSGNNWPTSNYAINAGTSTKLSTAHCTQCHATKTHDVDGTGAASTQWNTVAGTPMQRLVWKTFSGNDLGAANTVIKWTWMGAVWTSTGGTATHKILIWWDTIGSSWTTGSLQLAWLTFATPTAAARTAYPMQMTCLVINNSAGAGVLKTSCSLYIGGATQTFVVSPWNTVANDWTAGGTLSIGGSPMNWSTVQINEQIDHRGLNLEYGVERN